MCEPDPLSPRPRGRNGALIGTLLWLGASLLPGAALADGWREGTPMSSARAYAGAALIGDDLYVIGGGGTSGPRSMSEIYDTVGDIWRATAALPNGIQQFGIAVSGGKIFVAGGYASTGTRDNPVEQVSDNLWIFDPSVGTWVNGAPMPEPRVGHALVAVGGKIYSFGGRGQNPGRVFVYDPGADRWSTLKSAMPAPRADAAAVAVGNLVYVIGGHESSGATARVDIFDTDNDSWRAGPAMPAAREGHVAALLGGNIHVTGGESLSPPKTYADHFVLDVKSGTWTRADKLPTPRHGAVAAAAHGKLFVIGGSPGAGVYTVFTQTDVVEIYSGK